MICQNPPDTQRMCCRFLSFSHFSFSAFLSLFIDLPFPVLPKQHLHPTSNMKLFTPTNVVRVRTSAPFLRSMLILHFLCLFTLVSSRHAVSEPQCHANQRRTLSLTCPVNSPVPHSLAKNITEVWGVQQLYISTYLQVTSKSTALLSTPLSLDSRFFWMLYSFEERLVCLLKTGSIESSREDFICKIKRICSPFIPGMSCPRCFYKKKKTKDDDNQLVGIAGVSELQLGSAECPRQKYREACQQCCYYTVIYSTMESGKKNGLIEKMDAAPREGRLWRDWNIKLGSKGKCAGKFGLATAPRPAFYRSCRDEKNCLGGCVQSAYLRR